MKDDSDFGTHILEHDPLADGNARTGAWDCMVQSGAGVRQKAVHDRAVATVQGFCIIVGNAVKIAAAHIGIDLEDGWEGNLIEQGLKDLIGVAMDGGR